MSHAATVTNPHPRTHRASPREGHATCVCIIMSSPPLARLYHRFVLHTMMVPDGAGDATPSAVSTMHIPPPDAPFKLAAKPWISDSVAATIC